MFTVQLQDTTAADGTEVVLSCTVQGTPKPDVSWFHNDKNIDTSEDFVINFDPTMGKVDLVIVDCLPDDQGIFKCVATNDLGQAVTTARLTVQPKDDQLIQPMEHEPVRSGPPPHDQRLEEGMDITEDLNVTQKEIKVIKKVVKRTSGQPPRFSKPIQPCVVREGEACTFTAIVQGAPQPEINWLKDKVDFPAGPRFIMQFDRDAGLCSLTIKDAQPEDVGVYSCRASNLAGKATCTANVVVVRKYPYTFISFNNKAILVSELVKKLCFAN